MATREIRPGALAVAEDERARADFDTREEELDFLSRLSGGAPEEPEDPRLAWARAALDQAEGDPRKAARLLKADLGKTRRRGRPEQPVPDLAAEFKRLAGRELTEAAIALARGGRCACEDCRGGTDGAGRQADEGERSVVANYLKAIRAGDRGRALQVGEQLRGRPGVRARFVVEDLYRLRAPHVDPLEAFNLFELRNLALMAGELEPRRTRARTAIDDASRRRIRTVRALEHFFQYRTPLMPLTDRAIACACLIAEGKRSASAAELKREVGAIRRARENPPD